MILFFPGPQNFVISFMDKPPTPILMRWIFGPLGRVTVHHFQALCTTNSDKIFDWDHQRLQFSRVKEGQSRHKIAPWANKQPHRSFWSHRFTKTMTSMRNSSFVVTKTWNYLKPPKTTYNHLRKFNNHLQPSRTTSKTSTTTRKQSKTI